MEFLDKDKLKIRHAKKDRSIFLYICIILIPCVVWMIFAFLCAYIPTDFIQKGDGISVTKIGYFFAYNVESGASPKPSDFQFGSFNIINIIACAIVGIFMILVCYLNFYHTKKTIMNRFGYSMCLVIAFSVVLSNVFGQLAGQFNDEDPIGRNFFPIFFNAVVSQDQSILYQWNEAGIAMVSFSVLAFVAIIVMIPFWIYYGVKTGRISKNTGKIMMMKDEKSKIMLARDKVNDNQHHKED